MKRGFPRRERAAAPIIKPETIHLPTPLKVPAPEGKPMWLVVVAILVIGLVIGMVGITYASGMRTFIGVGSIFPIFMIIGVMSILGGRMGGGNQMSRAKMDKLRAQYMLTLDTIRDTAAYAADSMDENYRWYHPAPDTLAAAVGSARMWERKPDGKDLHFGVVRVGVGMIGLQEANVVTWGEPQDMPTDIELEPVTGKALQEFVRYQSVAYNVPSLISLLVEPGYALQGSRQRVLAVMRAIVSQLAFSHGPDHLEMIVVTSDVAAWDWVKWLPHFGDKTREDAAGPARMVYRSVAEFVDRHGEMFEGRGQFVPRHASAKTPARIPHVVVIADCIDAQWGYVTDVDGTDGITFFDVTGSSVPACLAPMRIMRFDDRRGVIDMVPRDPVTFAVEEGERAAFFALADALSGSEAEQFAFGMARWRLAEGYEEIGQGLERLGARDILSYYKIDDVAGIDFENLWSERRNPNTRNRLRVPFANRADNGELMFLDMKDMNDGGEGPHGVMSGTTGSGKTSLVRSVLLSILLGHPPDVVQLVLADLKGGSGVKPFAGVPHVSQIITDLERDQALMDRFIEAMWGEIARRKAICDSAGADDALEYNAMRSRAQARGDDMLPLPALVVMIDEFAEWFRIQPTAAEVLEQIGRQGRSYWVHLLMASQKIEGRGVENLMENMGYRLVLKTNTPSAAAAAGVPNALNLPKKPGLGYFRVGSDAASDIVRFQAEHMWREYRRAGDLDREPVAMAASAAYIRPQLFSTAFAPVDIGGDTAHDEVEALGALPELPGDLPEVVGGAEGVAEDDADSEEDSDEDDGAIKTPTVGTVIIDQLRRVDFQPYRLWQPPLDEPVTVEELVNSYLGRPWHQQYGSGANLVFPLGIIDRPFKHDQQPLLVDTAGPGAHVLILGGTGLGKTTALQTLICSAAMTHTPEQVQFYCLQFSSAALATVVGLPHVGGVAPRVDADHVRRTVAELFALMRERDRSFAACGIGSMEVFRRRKFFGESGPVPDDGFGDVFLVIDNYKAFADENEPLVELVNQMILQGRDYGVHVVATVDRINELRPAVRNGFGSRVELRLSAIEDTALVRPRQADAVPWRPGRGMVAQNYVRLGVDPAGLHTLIARPASEGSPSHVFESDRLSSAVASAASGSRRARPVRRLPARVPLQDLRLAAQADWRDAVGAGGIAFGVSELDLLPVYWNFDDSPHLIATGLRGCGRTTLAATVMTEIARVYAPGGSAASGSAPDGGGESADGRRSAQVWLIDPRRQLLTTLGSKYLERFAYTADGVAAMVDDLGAVLSDREPPEGLSAQQLTERSWWSGPEIFLIIDDIQRLPTSFESPLQKAWPWVTRAADVGLHVLCTRTFGGWNSGQAAADPMLRALVQANTPLLLMNADPNEGPVRDKIKGAPLPVGRGLLMGHDANTYVQVAIGESREGPQT
jgi:DNA segregation ATPase FtsK/SpoIIIE, S-DNA-T family